MGDGTAVVEPQAYVWAVGLLGVERTDRVLEIESLSRTRPRGRYEGPLRGSHRISSPVGSEDGQAREAYKSGRLGPVAVDDLGDLLAAAGRAAGGMVGSGCRVRLR
jgi:hypothetical protein